MARSPEHEALEFQLTNNTDKTITGYGVRFEIILLDGAKRSGGFGILGPLSDTGPGPRRIPPRGTAVEQHVVRQASQGSATAVNATLLWVIFADRSFIGDVAGVKLAFESRERQYQRYVFVVNALRAAQAEATGTDALRSALRRVGEAPDDMKDWLSHVRGNIQRALDGKVTHDSDSYLRLLIRSAEEERDRIHPHRRAPW